MLAILVHRYDPDTVFFIQDENNNTALFNTEEEIQEFVEHHPLRRVVNFFSYNIKLDEILRIHL